MKPELDEYQREMYEFLTKEEFYLGMIKSNELFPLVRETLLYEFWDAVYNKLKELIIEGGNKWELGISPDLKQHLADIYVYKREWEHDGSIHFFIGMERLMYAWPYYGIWKKADSSIYDIAKFTALIRQLPYVTKDRFEIGQDKFWCLWQRAAIYNVDQPSSLVAILPDRRKESVSEAAYQVYNLAEEMEEDLQKIVEASKL